MPFIYALAMALAASLWHILPALAVRVLVGLGVGAAVFTGMGALFDSVKGAIASQLGAMPADMLSILDMGGILDALSMIVSAYAITLALAGLNASGALSRWRWTPPIGSGGQWNMPGL